MDDTNEPPADGYKIGYAKPPLAGQFKKGQSGNPSGRPKRRNSASAMLKVLDRPVVIRAHGRRRMASLTEVLMTQLRDSALKGNPKANRELRDLIESFDDPPEAAPELSPEQLEAQQQRVKIYLDHIEVRDALIQLKLAKLNEDGRTKLCPEFFQRLFGPDYQDSDDRSIQHLLRSHLVGTPSV